MAIKNTGVRATAEEVTEARKRSRAVRDTPVVIVQGRSLADIARQEFQRWLDETAQKHGLPAPGLVDGEVNHYGMTNDGEFTVYDPAGLEPGA